MVSRLGLEDEGVVAFDSGEDGRGLDGPATDVGEDLEEAEEGEGREKVSGTFTRFRRVGFARAQVSTL